MGIFGGNGFQGPGEEFGNSWNSFSTGQGNFMTGPGGEKSNGQGQWNHHVSGPMGYSPSPTARPGDLTQAGSPSHAAAQQQGNILAMIDKLTSGGLLSSGGRMGRSERRSKEGRLGKTIREGFLGGIFGRNRGI